MSYSLDRRGRPRTLILAPRYKLIQNRERGRERERKGEGGRERRRHAHAHIHTQTHAEQSSTPSCLPSVSDGVSPFLQALLFVIEEPIH